MNFSQTSQEFLGKCHGITKDFRESLTKAFDEKKYPLIEPIVQNETELFKCNVEQVLRYEQDICAEINQFSGTTVSEKEKTEAINQVILDLRYLYFADISDFSSRTFTSRVSFQNSLFANGVHLNNITFSKDVDFNLVVFSEYVTFSNSIFSDKVEFIETEFLSNAYFTSTQFKQIATFYDAQFEMEADFDKAKFFEHAYFEGAYFSVANFNNTSFDDTALFNNSEFKIPPTFHAVKPHQGTSFEGTFFGRCKTEADYRAYRTLKFLMNSVHNHLDEGRFFAYEQRTRRVLDSKNWPFSKNWFSVIVSFCYDVFSEYGQNTLKPVAWFFSTIIVFMTVYALIDAVLIDEFAAQSTAMINNVEKNNNPWLYHMVPAMGLSLQNAFKPWSVFDSDPSFSHNNGWIAFLSFWQSLFSAAFIALWLLAIRRRFQKGE